MVKSKVVMGKRLLQAFLIGVLIVLGLPTVFGDASIYGTSNLEAINVTKNATFIGSFLNLSTANIYLNSSITPDINKTFNIGSPAYFLNYVYADMFVGNGGLLNGNLNMSYNDVIDVNISYFESIRSSTGNSIAVQPTGDTDDFFSFKTPSDRPTIKREGGKFIYIESTNVYDMGISFRDCDTYSGTINYEKDNHVMTMLGKNSPIGFKMNSDYDDYILFRTVENESIEITNIVTNITSFKINAGGNNSLLLNHEGGNVSIGKDSANTRLDVNGTITSDHFAGNGSQLYDVNYTDLDTNLTGTDVVSMVGNYSEDEVSIANWNKTYADGLYADISVTGDNASWNESYADTLYVDIDGDTATANSAFDWSNSSMTNISELNVTGQSYFEDNMVITGNITPSTNGTYSLGSPDFQWKDMYV